MITIAKSSNTDREVLFGNAADRAGISNPAIVEKISGSALLWIICSISPPDRSRSFLRAAPALARRIM